MKTSNQFHSGSVLGGSKDGDLKRRNLSVDHNLDNSLHLLKGLN